MSDWPTEGWVIWPVDEPYVSGAGVDGDIYDTEESAKGSMWATSREDGYRAIPYVPGDEVNWPTQEPGKAKDK